MTIYMNSVGLRYYALGGEKWQELFDEDGNLKPNLQGRKLVLRRAAGGAVDDAVEALCDSEQWGHVADGQKLVAVSWLAAREQQQATATVVGGDYAMHALIVRAELDAQSLSVAGRDLSGYEAWMRAAADFPVLLPVAAEQHLERLLSSLECLVGQGAWSHEQFEQLLPLLG